MKIARFWKRHQVRINRPDGRPIDVTTWGWSAVDAEDARLSAAEAAERTSKRIAAGEPFPDSYGYGDRPAREEIVREITSDDGETVAMITRNRYGALVLNTSDLMFIDVDVPPETPLGLIASIKSLFGTKPPDTFEEYRLKIAETARARPDRTFRVYRTAAGFRLMVVNKRVVPGTAESDALLTAFGSDPLYQRLCKNQESFRARLTPKPWRCGSHAPRQKFPFETPQDESRYREWQSRYDRASQGFATCKFIEQFGTDRPSANHRKLIDLHDQETKADIALPLA